MEARSKEERPLNLPTQAEGHNTPRPQLNSNGHDGWFRYPSQWVRPTATGPTLPEIEGHDTPPLSPAPSSTMSSSESETESDSSSSSEEEASSVNESSSDSDDDHDDGEELAI